jgi:hypothetical protein
MEGLVENPVNPFTGNAISSDRKSEPLLILTQRIRGINNTTIEINPNSAYFVHDNIFDEKNWTRPEKNN